MKNTLAILACLAPAVSLAQDGTPIPSNVRVAEFRISFSSQVGEGSISRAFGVTVVGNNLRIQSFETDINGNSFRGGVSISPIVCGSANDVVRAAVAQLPSRGIETGCGPNGSAPDTSRADRNNVGFGQSNPGLADDFFTGASSCRVVQFEGLTSRGEACLANVSFGNTSSAGGDVSTCSPGSRAGGRLLVVDSNRQTIASSTFSPGSFSYDARSRELTTFDGLDCNIRGFYQAPVDGKARPF
jgi:hypothetical protein